MDTDSQPQQSPTGKLRDYGLIDAILALFQLTFSFVGGGLLISAIVAFGSQVVTFLKTATWHSFGLDMVLTGLGWDWAAKPDTWLGVHWLISWIPGIPTVAGIGAWLLVAAWRSFKKQHGRG